MQSLAILIDSIRAMRSRYLFWISLAISILAAILLFGLISFNEQGWRVLWYETNKSDVYRAGSDNARDLIAWLFNSIYVKWWLSWGAIILAVISTASVIPDFLASGSIDLSLSKPISRLKLMGLKFLGAVLFVALQVSVGVGLAYLLMGVKIGIWLTVAFWAIPLVTLQFFYLYAISMLVAVVTRSTLASLLVTFLLWGAFSSVQFSSNQLDSNLAQINTTMDHLQGRIERIRARAAEQKRDLTPFELGRIESFQEQIGTYQPVQEMLNPWQSRTHLIEALVPKTADLQKILANQAEAPVLHELIGMSGVFAKQLEAVGMTDEDEFQVMYQAGLAGQRAIRHVNAWHSISTSLGLPVFALLMAGIVFVRKDY